MISISSMSRANKTLWLTPSAACHWLGRVLLTGCLVRTTTAFLLKLRACPVPLSRIHSDLLMATERHPLFILSLSPQASHCTLTLSLFQGRMCLLSYNHTWNQVLVHKPILLRYCKSAKINSTWTGVFACLLWERTAWQIVASRNTVPCAVLCWATPEAF